jgi:two-component system, OmpR family, sensor histidine kinase CreC
MDTALTLAIDDDGPGIPDFAKEKVFDKFFSLERPDTGRKSTGLGLNFVREVAHLHGGEIRLENREAQGLRATLQLPT